MRKPRILFCIDSLHNGGAEKILVEYLSQLGQGMDIYLLILCDYGVYFDSIPAYVRYDVWSRMSFEERENFNFLYFDIEVAFLEGLSARFIYQRKNTATKVCWIHTDMNAHNWCAGYFSEGEHIDECKNISISFIVSGMDEIIILRTGRLQHVSRFENHRM